MKNSLFVSGCQLTSRESRIDFTLGTVIIIYLSINEGIFSQHTHFFTHLSLTLNERERKRQAFFYVSVSKSRLFLHNKKEKQQRKDENAKANRLITH